MGIRDRKKREKEVRRQQIMVAAKEVFSVKGFAGTTMEDIARKAELSSGTLYLYFKNKDELFASLSLRILQFLNIKLIQIMDKAGQRPEDALHALKRALVEAYAFDPIILINLLQLQSSESINNLSPKLVEEINALVRNSKHIMAAIVSRSLAISPHAKPVIADILWSLFTGIALWQDSRGVIFEDDAQSDFTNNIDLGIDMMRRGIAAKPL